VHDELVVVQGRQRLAAGMQVAALGERDQLLDLGLDRLGLRLAGLDPLVLDQLLGEVGEQGLAMRRVAAELVPLPAVAQRSRVLLARGPIALAGRARGPAASR
jgi:hypothetical protein